MKKRNTTILIVSLIVPFLLCILLSVGMALRELKRDTAVTADILLSQVDHVTRIARHATRVTAGMADRPCADILENITATGAFTPYLRSTGLIRDDALVCSSVTGARVKNVRQMYGTYLDARTGDNKIFVLPGTLSVPGQEAIIYASRTDNGMIAFSVVDARYFIDLMDSLDYENHAVLHLQFSSGPAISSPDNAGQHTFAFRSEFRSQASQARLQVAIPLQSLRHYVLRNLLFLGPLFLLVSMAGIYLWRRWQTRQMSLAEELEKGIAQGEFSVHYQPVCETTSGSCTGAEALMRWQRRDGKNISPAVFIRAAEENGMITPLTRHLFELIIRDVEGWKISAPFHLGVNIAAAHLQQPSFITDVLRLWVALDQNFRLMLEITERSLVEDTSLAAEKLNALREKGCQVAVDDFGTGYCALSMLQSLPVDYLKIDKSFIDTLTSAGADTPILDTIVVLSQRLGLATIAEGISTAHQVEWLQANNVPYVQGYFYARPMPAAAFYQWYTEQSAQTLPARKITTLS
ncbi:EAL domain-containing protein [Enterobacter sp. ECC-249]|uniref:EAL domain-containing protein n=1 Tax=Enterobacter sp. ECC-249 TaxID=3116481 RepID=UPI0037545D77